MLKIPLFIVSALIFQTWNPVHSFSLEKYLGGDGNPTFEEIQYFKSNINESKKNLLNTHGTLAWGESYIMMSFIEMYEATEDSFFLNKFMEHCNAVLSHRDDVMGFTDVYREKVMPAWGSGSYGGTNWFVYQSHTGMITYPMAAFVRIVRNDPDLHPGYLRMADWYMTKVMETVDSLDDDWRESGNTGWYVSPHPTIPGKIPFNGMLAMGRTFVELYAAGAGLKYLDKATKLANYFKSHLRPGQHNSYDWYYGEDYRYSEDISHGAIDVHFAVLAYRNGIVFTREDIERFANTLVKVVLLPDGNLAARVNGLGGVSTSMTACGRWTELSEVNSKAYVLCHTFEFERQLKSSGQVGYARLMKWKPMFFPNVGNFLLVR